ncbi:MAG: ATP-dependent DNA ligase [Oscillatoria sp. Prado101]|jgi:bifunctional non-homologous end joining protein LigD|nr:ATP-dependent DNA ligase [Oscillatoria sp. Prado101]
MNLEEYIESKRNAKKRIPSEIRERWNSRILTRGLHEMGEAGAIQYLADYGKGIGAPKVVSLALCAESEGYPEMAQGFWRKAFELETGQKTPLPEISAGETPRQSAKKTSAATPLPILVPELPAHLQPGRIVTMQPVDAPYDRSHYIENPDFWGQPKRDGHRLVVIATPTQIYYQSRSTRLREQPSIEINQALLSAANQWGVFILDGELYYRSASGSEHRTGAQAATANIALGKAMIQPVPVCAIFKALFLERDLAAEPEAARIEAGAKIGETLPSSLFEVVPTARTAEEKAALALKQQSEEREGEIWLRRDCTYTGGKDSRNCPMVRTKYSLELDLLIAELIPTDSAYRPFHSIIVAQEIEGRLLPRGSVGTGFSLADMREIARRHAGNPGGVKITVRAQGLTESGKLLHGRFLGFCEESDTL